MSRSRLCDLLWDRPSDPRAELRWHLSKLRQIVDDPNRPRIISGEDEIGINLEGCVVDVLQVLSIEHGDTRDVDSLKELSELFRGQFLGEMDLAGPHAEFWLAAQRRRFAACRIRILRQLVSTLPRGSSDVERYLDRWLDLAPFEIEPHRLLLDHLVCAGRIAEANAHFTAAGRLLADEGMPTAELKEVWQVIKSRHSPASAATVHAAELVDAPATNLSLESTRRSALAIMPLTPKGNKLADSGIADGLTHDIITRLAKLRSLSIIAQGSVFALLGHDISDAEAGRRLGVDYVTSGTLSVDTLQLRVEIELIEVRSANLIWVNVFEAPAANLLEALEEISDRIVTALTGEIEQVERNRAVLRAPASLDAWGAYHRGLWHMYRFTKEENTRAKSFFEMAVRLDPTFSRAHAGLSFAHWQNAFQNWSDPAGESEKAYAAASQSLLADEQDPAAHWAMGRALWLRKQHENAVVALRESVALSPNFALGHYSLSFVEAQTGDALEAIKASDKSRALSPYDPLMFGMLGSRAIAHLRLGQFHEAAECATQAAARPNAHINILAIAALSLSLAGQFAEGRVLAAAINATQPRYGIDDFLLAFHFSLEQARILRVAATQVSLA